MSHEHLYFPASSHESVLQFFGRLFDADFVPRLECPPVSPPTRRGLGTVIIDGAIRFELKGSVHIEHLREGLRASLKIPLPTATRAGAAAGPAINGVIS